MSIVDSIIQAESGGNPNDKNPNSSASGVGQFIDSTWLNTIKRHRPDIAQGKSDQEILALKTDPALGREMTQAYEGDNSKFLASKGFDATPGNVYLAHFAGPQGAASLLSNPNARVEDVLSPGAVSANPFLRGMTASQVADWAARKVGGANAAPLASATGFPSPASAMTQAATQAAQQPFSMASPSAPAVSQDLSLGGNASDAQKAAKAASGADLALQPFSMAAPRQRIALNSIKMPMLGYLGS